MERYFVETETFRVLCAGNIDIIAGDKGTGKTALFKILANRYRSLPELNDIEIITAFNPVGNPVFQRLVQESALTEGQYKSVWKAYILSLIGNWTLNIIGIESGPNFERLNQLLVDGGLKVNDDTPVTVFSRLVNSIKRVFNPTAAETELTFSETGIPIVKPRIEFGPTEPAPPREVSHEEALRVLNNCLEELGLSCWVVLDRLDEAFQGFPAIEIPALRALLRTYLDLLEFGRIRVKLFIRRDLFRKIIGDGFVNLTHINAKKKEIVWYEEDLLNLLCARMKESGDFLDKINARDKPNVGVFDAVFPGQVEVGARKPTTWSWIMSRIRDGNQLKPPRNLIDLIMKAREAQISKEDREPREYRSGIAIIEAESIRRALSRLSEERVEDTLLAEAGDSVSLINKFRNQKSEQSRESLCNLLGISGDALEDAIRRLKEIGFLEETGQTFKVPILYREGLKIIQGKGFETPVTEPPSEGLEP